MKTVHVAAAIIKRINSNGQIEIYATQKGYGEHKGGWEFPGGKLEEGESSSEALKREIMEELNASINIGDFLMTVEYDYPNFHLSMDCFWATVNEDELVLNEALDAKWLTKEELDSVTWLPADKDIIVNIKKTI